MKKIMIMFVGLVLVNGCIGYIPPPPPPGTVYMEAYPTVIVTPAPVYWRSHGYYRGYYRR